MIHVPPCSRTTFTIVGTDPGTHNLGLAALHVDMLTFQIVSYEAYTLRATKLMHDEDHLVELHGHTFARVTALGDELVRRFGKLHPSQVACESAYFNRRTASAYAPLLQSINAIRAAVRDYNRFMPFTLIEPSAIRTAVGVKGKGRDKELILHALMKNKEFQAAKTTTPLKSLSDHASDALGIAYARLEQMRH